MKEYKRPRTPGLRLRRSEGQKDYIRCIPTNHYIEVVVKKVDRPESVTLDLYRIWYYGRWHIDEIKLKEGGDLEIADGLTVRIHDFRSDDRVCLQYIGPKDKYDIERYELVERDRERVRLGKL